MNFGPYSIAKAVFVASLFRASSISRVTNASSPTMAKIPMSEAVPVVAKKADLEEGVAHGVDTRDLVPGCEVRGRVEGVKRVMKPRHTQMIAIGGILGSGKYLKIPQSCSEGGRSQNAPLELELTFVHAMVRSVHRYWRCSLVWRSLGNL